MTKVLAGLGLCFIVLISVLALILGYFAYVGSKLDASSKTYVDQCIPSIISTWSDEAFISNCSPQLLKRITKEDIQRSFNSESERLGGFQSYDGSKGQSKIDIGPGGEKAITASYVATATFSNGKCNIQINIIQIAGQWKIIGFNINDN